MYICKRKTKNDMKRILSLAFAIVLLATLPMQGQGKRYQVAGVANKSPVSNRGKKKNNGNVFNSMSRPRVATNAGSQRQQFARSGL